jgi:hypothetical protein
MAFIFVLVLRVMQTRSAQKSPLAVCASAGLSLDVER